MRNKQPARQSRSQLARKRSTRLQRPGLDSSLSRDFTDILPAWTSCTLTRRPSFSSAASSSSAIAIAWFVSSTCVRSPRLALRWLSIWPILPLLPTSLSPSSWAIAHLWRATSTCSPLQSPAPCSERTPFLLASPPPLSSGVKASPSCACLWLAPSTWPRKASPCPSRRRLPPTRRRSAPPCPPSEAKCISWEVDPI